jgi:hypothetical protein
MTTLQRNSLGVALLVALASGALLLQGELPPPAPDEVQADLSKRACYEDGGRACVALFYVDAGEDAGFTQEWRQLAACDCARQPIDGGDCRALWLAMDGGLEPVDLGPGTRFAADASIGASCELIPCSIYAGQNPDLDECAYLPDGGVE